MNHRLVGRAAEQELQPGRGLAAARRAHHHRHRMLVDAAAQHPVDTGYPDRHLGTVRIVPHARRCQQRLGARENRDTAIGDPIGMAAAHEPAAAQLVHLHLPLGTAAMQRRLQFDQPIHHGVLGRKFLVVERAGQQEHGAVGEGGLRLQLMNEFLQLEIRRRLLMNGNQPVQHQRLDLPGPHFTPHHVEKPAQTVIVENPEGTDEGHTVGNRALVEKGQPLHMADHARVALGQQRDVERAAPGSRVRKTNLVAQDGLAGARRTLDDVDATVEHAAAEDRVETRDTCRKAVILTGHTLIAPT